MQITDSEYQEYQHLKAQAERIAIFSSLKEVSTLEDDIDLPIKKCVAYLALLGCEPVWSCCGFDYVGQPLHKFHQYGRVFFILKNKNISRLVVDHYCEYNKAWKYKSFDNIAGSCLDFYCQVPNVIPQWDNSGCVHFSETLVWEIDNFEKFLFVGQENFAESAVLRDTNLASKETLEHWQYPPKADWMIRKSDYIKE